MIKMNKRQLSMARKIILNIGVVALLCLWFMSINRTSVQLLSGVEVIVDNVEGERNLISKKDIHHLVTKELPNDIMTQKITRVNIGMIESLLRSDTRIFAAEVFIDAHQKLIVDVIQRRPVLRVMNHKNDQFYVDQGGEFVRKVDDKASRVPVITGYVESFDKNKDLNKLPRLKSAYEMIMQIRKDAVLRALIEQIHFEKESRIVLIPKIGDEKIIIDHLDQFERKLNNLKTFYKHLAKTDGWEKYEEIDISYYNQVVPRNLDNP